MSAAATIPYRPSNGTEGEFFYGDWCSHCTRESEKKPCRIFTATMAFRADDQEYPREWVSDRDGGNARCTAFRKRVKRIRKPGPMPLFGMPA